MKPHCEINHYRDSRIRSRVVTYFATPLYLWPYPYETQIMYGYRTFPTKLIPRVPRSRLCTPGRSSRRAQTPLIRRRKATVASRTPARGAESRSGGIREMEAFDLYFYFQETNSESCFAGWPPLGVFARGFRGNDATVACIRRIRVDRARRTSGTRVQET